MSSILQLQQSHLDFDKVSPIEKNRLIAFVNHFIINVVRHLNDITNLVDSKLHALNNKLNICHSNLVILETKLNSIPGLSSAVTSPVAKPTAVSAPIAEPQNDEQRIVNDEQTASGEKTTLANDTNSEDTQSEQNSNNEETDEPKQNPLLAKYNKMLQIGVPLGAVRQKMLTDGIDPDLLKV